MATATALKEMPPAHADGTLLEIPIAAITIAGDNPRRKVGDVTELAASIASVGILQPLAVVPRAVPGEGIQFLLLAGHRRLAAAKLAELESVPCFVRTLEDADRIASMLIENLHREDLAALEEAAGYKRLIDEFGMGQRELADKVGRSQGHISKRLALLDLPKNVQAAVDSGGITLADAGELAKLKDHPSRLAFAFTRGAQWGGHYARAVADQMHEMKVEAKIEQAKTKLRETGIKVISFKKDRYGHMELPSGTVEIGGWDARRRGLEKVTVANHKNEPCHAAAIDPRDAQVVYVCTKPASHKGETLETPADEKERARKERERDKTAQLRARAKNVELGRVLEAKLAAPKIDERNMRLLADLLMLHDGSEIANRGTRYVDEASQTVITKKDGTVSRIVHADPGDAKRILERRLMDARTPEAIMGVLLQALLAAKLTETKAVPQSQRFGHVRGLSSGYATGTDRITKPLDAIAKAAGIDKATAKGRRGK